MILHHYSRTASFWFSLTYVVRFSVVLLILLFFVFRPVRSFFRLWSRFMTAVRAVLRAVLRACVRAPSDIESAINHWINHQTALIYNLYQRLLSYIGIISFFGSIKNRLHVNGVKKSSWITIKKWYYKWIQTEIIITVLSLREADPSGRFPALLNNGILRHVYSWPEEQSYHWQHRVKTPCSDCGRTIPETPARFPKGYTLNHSHYFIRSQDLETAIPFSERRWLFQ